MTNWKKPFFKEMEKMAIAGAVMGIINTAATISDIKLNKARTRLAAPMSKGVANIDPYTRQFAKSTTSTPGRSLF